MDAFYEKVIRPIFFTQNPEFAHESALKAMKIVASVSALRKTMECLNLVKTQKPINVFGLNFPNRVGLAAGFDKDAHAWRSAQAFGFGHIEIGTVSKHKQTGNPKPRIFRYPKAEAVVNSCGFPNDGADEIAKRLASTIGKSFKKTAPLGINIGKSKITPLEEAADDYLYSFNALADYADFFVVNVSSPNTPELRKLQGSDFLPNLLNVLKTANEERSAKLGVGKIPIILKIAPDLTFAEIDSILSILFELKLDGICATNTTISRPDANMHSAGGLSGKPLFEKSLGIVKYISKATNAKLPIIGVGGITDVDKAGQMMNAGASLVQIYTGMIYRGPFFAQSLAKSQAWRDKEWL